MRGATSRARPKRGNALATRERLLQAAIRAFSEKGLEGVNLRSDIIEPAGVGVGSFYHQFKDKTELMLALIEQQSELFRAAIARALIPGDHPEGNYREVTRRTLTTLFDVVEDAEDMARVLLRERHSAEPRVRAFLEHNRDLWIAHLASHFDALAEASGDRLDTKGLADIILTLAEGALTVYLDIPAREQPAARERMLHNMTVFIIGGIEAFANLSQPDATGPQDAVSESAAGVRIV